MPATMTQLPKEIDGYPILSLIGEGAFSKIYAAKDPKTRQLLALKHVIINDPKKDERWVEQMESETKIANALDPSCAAESASFQTATPLVEITGCGHVDGIRRWPNSGCH